MHRRSKPVQLYSRIVKWFLRFQRINAVTVNGRSFSHIDSGVIAFEFTQRVSSDKVCGRDYHRTKAKRINQRISSIMNDRIHGYHLESFSPSRMLGLFLPILPCF